MVPVFVHMLDSLEPHLLPVILAVDFFELKRQIEVLSRSGTLWMKELVTDIEVLKSLLVLECLGK